MRKWSLPIGLLFGIIAAAMVFMFLKEQERKAAGPPPPKVGVVVARNDIPSGAKISPDMVMVQQVLAETRHPLAVQSLSELDGKLSVYPLVKGEQVLSSRVSDRPKSDALAGVVPAGKRAISVGATDVVGVGGLIVPGDRVDVMAVFESRDGGGKGWGSAVIAIEDVEVLAMAKDAVGVEQAKDPTLQAATDAKKSASAQTSMNPDTKYTITLALTPEEAEKLMLADRAGTLRLALRARGDNSRATITEMDVRSMVKSQ